MGRWRLIVPLKVTLPCLLLGVIFYVVSFSVSFWVTLTYKDTDVNVGLWTVCVHVKGDTLCSGWSADDFIDVQGDLVYETQATIRRFFPWMHKNQALQCLALVLLLGALGAMVVFFLTDLKAAIVTTVVTCFMSALFMDVGCAVFSSDVSDDNLFYTNGKLGWAFGLTIVGAVFLTVAGLGLIVHILSANTASTNTTTNTAITAV